jgi:hypothetical protein
MTAVTESDLKRLEDLIVSRFDELAQGQRALEKGQQAIEIRLTAIKTRLSDWKPAIDKVADLAEKVGELKNWKQAGLLIIAAFTSSILSSLIGGVIGWLIRGSRFNSSL